MGGIRFTPELPDETLRAIHNIPMGLLAKIPIEIRGDRLGLQPFQDVLADWYGKNDVYFLAFPFDSDLMVGFVGGDFAWELSTAGEEAAIDFAAQSLERIFGSSIREKIGRGSLTPWGADRWSRGAYSAVRPGESEARTILARQIADNSFLRARRLGDQ